MREQEDLAHDVAFIATGGLLSPAVMAKITKDFVMALEPELLLRQLCGTDTELERGGGDRKRFRKITALSEDNVKAMDNNPEDSTPDDVAAEVTPSYADATPSWWGFKDRLSYQSIKTADYNAVNLLKTGMVRAWARFVDKKVRNAILAVKTVTSEVIGTNIANTTPTTVSLANPYVYKITSIAISGGGTVAYDRVNYLAGKIRFEVTGGDSTNSVTLTYDCANLTTRPVPLYRDAASFGKLSLSDILAAKLQISSKNGKPTALLCYEDEAGDLLTDDHVIANVGYDYNALYKGSVAKLYNLEVMSTNFWYPGIAVVLQPGDTTLMYVVQDKFGTKITPIADTIGDQRIMMWESFAVVCLNDDMICTIFDCASDAHLCA